MSITRRTNVGAIRFLRFVLQICWGFGCSHAWNHDEASLDGEKKTLNLHIYKIPMCHLLHHVVASLGLWKIRLISRVPWRAQACFKWEALNLKALGFDKPFPYSTRCSCLLHAAFLPVCLLDHRLLIYASISLNSTQETSLRNERKEQEAHVMNIDRNLNRQVFFVVECYCRWAHELLMWTYW